MPTTYWRDVARHQVEREPSPSLVRFVTRFTRWRPPPQEVGNPLFKSDPDAQAVLLQLALDPGTEHQIRVRAFAACTGAPLKPHDYRAVEQCLADDDRTLRHEAACLLVRLNGSDSALELLVADCTADLRAGPFRRDRAWHLLWRVARHSPALDIDDFARRLSPMLRDDDPDVRATGERVMEIIEEVRAQRK